MAAPAHLPIVLLTQLVSRRVSGYLRDNKYAADSEQSILVYQGKPMPAPKSDVKISRVTELAEIQAFVNVRGRPSDYVQMYKSAIDGGDTRLYLAKIDNVPVGAALTFFADGVATLHDLDVLSAFRNRGVGTALIVYRIRELICEKCNLIWTNPNRDTLAEGILIRLGMEPVEHTTLFKKNVPLYKRLVKRLRNF
jgi:GNAT superfamily N-acetyltransferase